MLPSIEGSVKGGVSVKTKTPQSKKLRLELVGPCWSNLRGTRHLFALILLPSLAGCFAADTRPYPKDWPPVTTVPAGQCPRIAGQYWNGGSNVIAPRLTCAPALKGSWNCDATLSGNLVKMKAIEWHELQQVRAVSWIKLEQPDDDTLEVHFPSATQLEPKVFKRSQGDFDCDGSGLRFSISASLYSDERSSTGDTVLMTTLGLLSVSEGVASAKRVFRPLQDGSLSMEVTDSKAAVLAAIFASAKKFNAFVRWEQYVPHTPGYVSAADFTQFRTADGTVGYNIHCARGGTVMPCSPKAYEEADTLCGDNGYSVVSATYRGASIQDEVFTLLVQCKK